MDSTPPTPARLPLFRLPLALGAVLGVVLLARGWVAVPVGGGATSLGAGETGLRAVELARRAPGEADAHAAVPWRAGMTVRDAVETAALDDPRGPWRSRWRGVGSGALLEELGGRPNEGPGRDNWQFEVDGEYGVRSAAATTLRPGQRVLWRLAPYE
ncbi:MAG: hypothetical protein ACRCT8_08720 [Lacipirellulaceae bacterium]